MCCWCCSSHSCIGHSGNMVVMSIDHGTSSGYAVFIDGEYHASGIIKLGSITNLSEGYTEYESLINFYEPNVIVLEKINIAGRKFGALNIIKLAQLQAMIRLLCDMRNIVIYEVNPISMKKFLTDNGKAEKHIVAKHLADMWNLREEDICVPIYYSRKEGIKGYIADESDAIGLGTYYVKNVDK